MKLDPVLPDVLTGNVLSGRKLAAHVKNRVAEVVQNLREHQGVELCLAVVLVGADPASAVYVRNKVRACKKVGIQSRSVVLSREVSQEALIQQVRKLNDDDSVDGVLVQLPLPEHIDEDAVIDAVDPAKDVDGFHPANLGLLLGREALLQPCTPSGVMLLLAAAGVPLKGARALVVGRSVIVGRPMTQLLIRAHATVTCAHRHTTNLAELVAESDVLVVATGVPHLIRGEWVKEGAVVIDVGINRREDGSLTGDVEFDEAVKRASAITPVPGGVGPMTIAMLMWNTTLAARLRRGVPSCGIVSPL
ncbi:MAG: methylenetetrahydrofolate dehydrogenase (NADP+)/methenyltetrahydrofolate cyclohydrolase [Bradymonadia bacterium]|jgi:methylenetetrahydrofolate dehydrogenase (NADP+)/methenyltetrahydrofolate cyclohydrolase